MLKSTNAIHFVVAILSAILVTRPMPAAAQQNPFLGTWSTTQAEGHITAFLDFYANGTLHLSGVASGTGVPSHVCGVYQFNQSMLQYVFTSYTPKVCALGQCDPMVPMNQQHNLGYQFPNAGLLVFSDGSRYVRQQQGNPYPLPPNGCSN